MLYDNATNVGVGTNAPGSKIMLDVNGAESMRGMAAPGLSPVGQGRIYFDSTSNQFMVSQNGGAYAALVGGGGGGAFSSLTGAATTDTINNANNTQTWNWNSATTQNGLIYGKPE